MQILRQSGRLPQKNYDATSAEIMPQLKDYKGRLQPFRSAPTRFLMKIIIFKRFKKENKFFLYFHIFILIFYFNFYLNFFDFYLTMREHQIPVDSYYRVQILSLQPVLLN